MEELEQRIRNIEEWIKDSRNAQDRVLSLSFLAVLGHINHHGMALFGQALKYWEDSPLFVDMLNLALERGEAAFAQAESRRRGSRFARDPANTATHPCHAEECKASSQKRDAGEFFPSRQDGR